MHQTEGHSDAFAVKGRLIRSLDSLLVCEPESAVLTGTFLSFCRLGHILFTVPLVPLSRQDAVSMSCLS